MNRFKDEVVSYCSEKKDSLIKLLFCVLFFTFVLIITRNNNSEIKESLNKLTTNKNDIQLNNIEDEELQNEEYYYKLLDNLTKNNFDLTINIKKDKETKKLALSREYLGKEVLYLKENDNEEYYYKNEEAFYKLENDKLVKSDYVNIFKYEIDMFYDMNDLVSFLKTITKTTLNLDEKNSFYKYKVKLSELLDFYNQHYSSNLSVEEDDISIINVYFYSEIKKIIFDFTTFYNYLYHTDYKNVEYEFVFSNIGKQSLTEIDDLTK